MDEKRDAITAYIRKMHEGQKYGGGVPSWHHMARVAEHLEMLLEETGEGAPAERRTIVLAAYGHDLFEDTKATKGEVKELFGADGLAFIGEMTNEWGDEDVSPYVKKMTVASEGARLTKLADLNDNITGVINVLPILGLEWTTSFFLPIVEPMAQAMARTSFDTYRQTGTHLQGMVARALTLLRNEIARHKAAERA